MKSIQTPLLSGIQISDPLLMGMDFFWQQGVTSSLLAKFCQNPKFQDFPLNFLVNFNS
jgi:hypothetical protein